MEIIGKTNEGYLIDLTSEELAGVNFSNSEYNEIEVMSINGSKETRECASLEIGDEIEVTDNYNKAREIKESYDDMKKIISQIKSSITKFENSLKQ